MASAFTSDVPIHRTDEYRKVYRGNPGFSIVGTDALGTSGLSIFVRTREGAERIAEAYRQSVDPYGRAARDAYREHTHEVTRQVFADENPGDAVLRRMARRRGSSGRTSQAVRPSVAGPSQVARPSLKRGATYGDDIALSDVRVGDLFYVPRKMRGQVVSLMPKAFTYATEDGRKLRGRKSDLVGGYVPRGAVVHRIIQGQTPAIGQAMTYANVPPEPGYSISEARYAKGQMLVRCPSNDIFKTRAAYLAGALRGRYTGREKGYVMSPSKVRKFERLYAEGWDANPISLTLIPPKGHTDDDAT